MFISYIKPTDLSPDYIKALKYSPLEVEKLRLRERLIQYEIDYLLRRGAPQVLK